MIHEYMTKEGFVIKKNYIQSVPFLNVMWPLKLTRIPRSTRSVLTMTKIAQSLNFLFFFKDRNHIN